MRTEIFLSSVSCGFVNSAEVTGKMAIYKHNPLPGKEIVFLNTHSDISLVLFTVAYGM
jgi:hypothetical protein